MCKIIKLRSRLQRQLSQNFINITFRELFVLALPNSEDTYDNWLECYKEYNNDQEQWLQILALINTVKMHGDSIFGTTLGQANFTINENETVTIFLENKASQIN